MQYTEHIKEDGTKLKIPHPITYQSVVFQGSQKNWSTLTKEAYAIYMSCKMVFYLKEANVMVRCNHALLQKFIYSVIKNDKLNNGSHEIQSITPHIDFKHIKGKENMLVDSLSRLRCLCLHEDNHSENSDEYGKSILTQIKIKIQYVVLKVIKIQTTDLKLMTINTV